MQGRQFFRRKPQDQLTGVILIPRASAIRGNGDSAMPTDWAAKVRDAITNLEIKTGRVLEPDRVARPYR